MLLGRIAEGVRPRTKPAASRLPAAELPPASTWTHPSEYTNGGGEDGNGRNSNTHTKTWLPRVDPPCTLWEGNEKGGRGPVQSEAAPTLSSIVSGMNDRTRKGRANTQETSRNARANRVLREARMVPAANFGPAKTSGPTSPLIAKKVLRKGLTGSSEKENQPSIS